LNDSVILVYAGGDRDRWWSVSREHLALADGRCMLVSISDILMNSTTSLMQGKYVH